MAKSAEAGAWVCIILGIVLFPFAAQANTVTIEGTIFQGDYDRDGEEDDETIDYITFDVTAGATVVFDILSYEHDGQGFVDLNGDGELLAIDTTIFLFAGTDVALSPILASNDDQEVADINGSIHVADSYLEYTFTNAGTYTLAIGDFAAGEAAAVRSGVNLDSFIDEEFGYFAGNTSGDYRLDIITEDGLITNPVRDSTPVPEPGTLTLFAMGALGLLLKRNRRK